MLRHSQRSEASTNFFAKHSLDGVKLCVSRAAKNYPRRPSRHKPTFYFQKSQTFHGQRHTFLLGNLIARLRVLCGCLCLRRFAFMGASSLAVRFCFLVRRTCLLCAVVLPIGVSSHTLRLLETWVLRDRDLDLSTSSKLPQISSRRRTVDLTRRTCFLRQILSNMRRDPSPRNF